MHGSLGHLLNLAERKAGEIQAEENNDEEEAWCAACQKFKPGMGELYSCASREEADKAGDGCDSTVHTCISRTLHTCNLSQITRHARECSSTRQR